MRFRPHGFGKVPPLLLGKVHAEHAAEEVGYTTPFLLLRPFVLDDSAAGRTSFEVGYEVYPVPREALLSELLRRLVRAVVVVEDATTFVITRTRAAIGCERLKQRSEP